MSRPAGCPPCRPVHCARLDAGALLIASLIVLIPGIGASLALHRPGEASVATRIALSFGLGYATVALTGVVLEVLHVLSEGSFVVLLAAVTIAMWVTAVRRGGLRAHGSALAAELREERWLVLSGLAMLAGFAVMRLQFSPLINFSMFGPWRYWADGLEIADAGRVPQLTLQWGATYTPTVSKVILNSYHAGLSYLIGSAPLPAMGALLWVAAVGFAAALWSLGRELGLRYTAALVPPLVLVLFDNELHRDLDVYTAENVGRMAAVCALALGVRTLRSRGGRAETIATGVLFAVAAGSHGIPAFVMLLGLGCYAVALMLVEPDRRGVVLRVGAVLAVTLLVWGASLGLSGGDVGFQGAKGSNRYAAFGAGVDPTASLFTGELVTRAPDSDHWYISPEHLLRGFVASSITRPASDLWLVAIPLGTLLVAIAMLVWFPDELRPLGLAVWLLGAVLVAVALLFSYRYSTYIPGTFGPHRLYDYACLLLTLVGLGCLEARAGFARPGAAVAARGGGGRAGAGLRRHRGGGRRAGPPRLAGQRPQGGGGDRLGGRQPAVRIAALGRPADAGHLRRPDRPGQHRRGHGPLPPADRAAHRARHRVGRARLLPSTRPATATSFASSLWTTCWW